jgi:hypothetical protein
VRVRSVGSCVTYKTYEPHILTPENYVGEVSGIAYNSWKCTKCGRRILSNLDDTIMNLVGGVDVLKKYSLSSDEVLNLINISANRTYTGRLKPEALASFEEICRGG